MKKYVCDSPILFSLSIITAILYCTMGTFFSFIMGQIVDAAGTGTAELIEKFMQGLVFVLVYVLVTILYGILKNILIGKSRESLKSALFKATLSAPTSDYSGTNTAEYINDLTNNLSIFENCYEVTFVKRKYQKKLFPLSQPHLLLSDSIRKEPF